MRTDHRRERDGPSAKIDRVVCAGMTSLVGTMKHVSTLSQNIVIRHTMSRPCRARVASVS
eukprot:7094967-Prymnesium_polylepis.1